MAERRGRDSRANGGWISKLSVAVIVIAAGFAVGLVAGVSWEEPGLVIGYLTGDTDAIDWGSDPTGASDKPLIDRVGRPAPQDVAAPPPSLGGSRPEAEPASPRPAPPPAPRAAPPVKSRPPSSEAAFAVQVGAFAEQTAAQGLAESLRGQGYRVYLSSGEGSAARWRVRVGPFSTRDEAERAAGRLKSGEKLPTWVLSEES
jgi:cell division septation protein DedD